MLELEDIRREVGDLVARDQVRIPPYPAVALQIDRLVRSGDFGIEDLARLVASDERIAADVLRAGNSYVYARGRTITSIKQAVAAIGAADVGKVALAAALGAAVAAPGKLAALRRQAWIDALASAFLCQALARGRNLPADVAFAAGLLHDFGKIIAIASIEQVLAPRDDVAALGADEWCELVDLLHVELGLAVAVRWKLPPIIADAISLHHAVTLAAPEHAPLVETVAASDEVTAILRAGPSLSAEGLVRAPRVQPREHGAVLAALQALPDFVASFETEPAASARPAPRSLVRAPPPLRADECALPPAVPVVLKLGARRIACRLLGIAATHCVLSAPTSPLPENQLLGLEIASTPPILGFASVKVAWPDANGTSMLVQPYALSKDALAAWNALVQASAPG